MYFVAQIESHIASFYG